MKTCVNVVFCRNSQYCLTFFSNLFPPSGALLFVVVQCSSGFGFSTEQCSLVRLGLLILAFPPSGAALFAYIGVSTAKSWARSRNKHAKPTYFSTLLCWVTKPSERVAEM